MILGKNQVYSKMESKIKQIIGGVLLIGMSVSLWYKLEDGLKDTAEPLAFGALIFVVFLFLVVLIIRIIRS